MFRTGLRVNQYYHYCGGVAPSYAQMNNYQPLSNVSFVLVNLETCEQCIVQADSTGIIRLYLPKGSYGIKEMYKNCTFDEFLKANPRVQNQYVLSQEIECYKTWWTTYLCEFILINTTQLISLERTISSAFFTGNNPCITYFGPYPP